MIKNIKFNFKAKNFVLTGGGKGIGDGPPPSLIGVLYSSSPEPAGDGGVSGTLGFAGWFWAGTLRLKGLRKPAKKW